MKILIINYQGSFWRFDGLYQGVLYEIKKDGLLYIEKMLSTGETTTLHIFKNWDRIDIEEIK